MRFIQAIQFALLLSISSVSMLHAQYYGGIGNAAPATVLNQANCSAMVYPDIFNGGVDSSLSMGQVTQIDCNPVVLGDIFKGGIDSSAAMAQITQASCVPFVYVNIFTGGVDDGHTMDLLSQVNCEPLILGDIFTGGIDDGHTMNALSQVNCEPLILGDIFAGGIEDGHAMEVFYTACAPNARFEADTTVICVGETLQFTDYSTGPPLSWSWTFTGGTPSSSTDQHPSVVYDTPGTYSVSLSITSADGNNSVTEIDYITVLPTPTPAIVATGSTTFCDGDSVLLSTAGVYDNYLWSNGDTLASTYVRTAGVHTLTATSSNGCAGESNPITITVLDNPKPEVFVNAGASLCIGDTVTLTSSIADDYLWSPGGETTQSIKVWASGTFWVTSNATSGCSRTSDEVELNFGTPPAPVVIVSGSLDICAGDSVLLSTQTADAYLWYPTGDTTQSIWAKADGNYRVEAFSGTSCATLSSEVTVTVSPLPIANVNAVATTLCEGEDIMLTAANSPGASYAWSGPNGFTSTNQIPTISSATTLHSGWYTLTTTLSSCSAVDSIEINVNTAPIADANALETTLCGGEDINLTAANSLGATYAWTGPNGFTSTDQNPTISGATVLNAGWYYLTTASGCEKIDSVEIIIEGSPIANAGAIATELCEGEIIRLTAENSPGATFSWSGPYAFVSTDQIPVISSAEAYHTGWYYLTSTLGSCSLVDSVEVTVTPMPVAVAGALETAICRGEDINLTAANSLGATYAWTGPDGFTSTDQNPTISEATIANAGLYTLTTTINGCEAVDVIQIDVGDTPVADADALETTLCESEDIKLVAANSAGATFSWVGPYAFSSTSQIPVISSAETYRSGWYYLTVTANGCSKVDSVEVTVTPMPIANASAIKATLCEGEDINLMAASSAGATYAWTGPNGFTSTDQNPIISEATTANAGLYTLTTTINGCSAVDDIQITVDPMPIANANAIATTLCEGEDIRLTAANSPGATFSWSGPYGYASADQNPIIGNVTTVNAGWYYLTTSSANGCSDLDSVEINIDPALIANANVLQTVVCEGGDIALSTSTIGNNYLWTGPNGFTSALQNPTLSGVSALASGYYILSVDSGTGDCLAKDSVQVTVNAAPVLSITGNDIACYGESNGSAEVKATGNGPFIYTWSPSGGTGPSIDNLSAGTYTVTVEDANGCSNQASVTITEPNLLNVVSVVEPASCGENNGRIDISVNGGTPGYSYSWLPNGETTASIQGLSEGDYSLIVTDNMGCSFNSTYTVSSVGDLAVQVLPEEATINKGESIGLSVNIDPSITGETYTWTPTDGLSCVSCPNPTASPSETTIYTVQVSTPDNCSGTSSSLISVLEECVDVYVPTIFSPNGDGVNDEFCIYGGCINTFSLQIFNRWGEMVYDSDNETNCWDGTFKGKKLNTDVFAYRLVITTLQGEEIEKSGNINLVR